MRGLRRLVAAPGGPIGAIVTLYRNGRTTVVRAGRADVTRPGAPRLGDHMRIASISKAFSGAVALHLVAQGRLGLNDTIGRRLPGMMPPAWSGVTVRQMLNHTSGLPDYTQSDGFREQATKNPRGYVSPMRIIDWVRGDDLNFTARFALRVLQHGQHRRCPDRTAGQWPILWSAALEDRLPAGWVDADDVPDAEDLAAGAVHTRLSGRAGQAAAGRDHVSEPERCVGIGRHRLHPGRPRRVHPGGSRRPVLRQDTATPADAVRPRLLEPGRPRHQLRGAGDIPLPDALRHRLRSHGQLPRLRAVGRRHGQRPAIGDDIAQHPSADGAACWRSCAPSRHQLSARCSASNASGRE